ncbi:MAG TPA: hypothetical protein VJH97_07415 [Candidatus Nanoarchaeia archaeon]|nr:hypothetical protein [Candidatus Nanoarchaeia archaeon]
MAEHEEEEVDEMQDESVYGAENRADLVEGDAMSAEEEAFMEGYDAAESDEPEEVVEEDE